MPKYSFLFSHENVKLTNSKGLKKPDFYTILATVKKSNIKKMLRPNNQSVSFNEGRKNQTKKLSTKVMHTFSDFFMVKIYVVVRKGSTLTNVKYLIFRKKNYF